VRKATGKWSDSIRRRVVLDRHEQSQDVEDVNYGVQGLVEIAKDSAKDIFE
jgi:hypothetical protein